MFSLITTILSVVIVVLSAGTALNTEENDRLNPAPIEVEKEVVGIDVDEDVVAEYAENQVEEMGEDLGEKVTYNYDCSEDMFDSYVETYINSEEWQSYSSNYELVDTEVSVAVVDASSQLGRLTVCRMKLQYESKVYPDEDSLHGRDNTEDMHIQTAIGMLIGDPEFNSTVSVFEIGSSTLYASLADGPYATSNGSGIATDEWVQLVGVLDTYWFTTPPYKARELGVDQCPCKKVMEINVTVPLTDEMIIGLGEE